jgi:hypothetical protein
MNFRFNSLPLRGLVLAALALPLLAACVTPMSEEDARRVERAKVAKVKFEAYCKNAGEKIYRTAENVEGVFLLKIRTTTNFGGQFVMDDPYGHDVTGNEYIESFLGIKIKTLRPAKFMEGDPPRNGYKYVEAVAEDGRRYRYTGYWDQPWLRDKSYGEWVREFALKKELATGPAPRYGVTYDDLSTREDREYWIAGSSLRVIDLQTNEVMAERIGYMWDPAQGRPGGGRSPWLIAASYSCPGFDFNPNRPKLRPAQPLGQTEHFVEKILIPKVEK